MVALRIVAFMAPLKFVALFVLPIQSRDYLRQGSKYIIVRSVPSGTVLVTLVHIIKDTCVPKWHEILRLDFVVAAVHVRVQVANSVPESLAQQYERKVHFVYHVQRFPKE